MSSANNRSYDIRSIAASLCLELTQLRVDRVEIVGQLDDSGDIRIAAVAVSDQANPQIRRGFAASDLVADRPDLVLGALNEAAHSAGGVQAEDYLDFGPGFFGLRFVIRGESGQSETNHGHQRCQRHRDTAREAKGHGDTPAHRVFETFHSFDERESAADCPDRTFHSAALRTSFLR